MNVKLAENDFEVDFYSRFSEMLKLDEDIKGTYINDYGSVLILVTKSNQIRFYDFVGKSLVFTIKEFKDTGKNIISVSITKDSKLIFVSYFMESTKYYGISIIKLFFESKFYYENYKDFMFEHQILNTRIKESALLNGGSERKVTELYINGREPQIFCLEDQSRIVKFYKEKGVKTEKGVKGEYMEEDAETKLENYRGKAELKESKEGKKVTKGERDEKGKSRQEKQDKQDKPYNYYITDLCDTDFYLLCIKESYCICVIKDNSSVPTNSSSFFEEKKESHYEEKVNHLNDFLDKRFSLVDIFSIDSNCEINSVQVDITKSLILVNSNDKYLRLFKYNQESHTITQVKDFFDSVNRRKWLNSYFYTFKPSNSVNELIVTALSDSNTLEIVFIDILTGNYSKRLDPIKFHCNDFCCQYNNHFSLIVQANKRVLLASGYYMNNHGTYAPKFKYIENNIEFVEEEDFFENFQNNIKLMQNKTMKPINVNSIFRKKKIAKKLGDDGSFEGKAEVKRDELFNVEDCTEYKETEVKPVTQENTSTFPENRFLKFYYKKEEDAMVKQSMKELTDVMDYFNELVDIKNFKD